MSWYNQTPTIAPKPWMSSKQMVLVTSAEMLKEAVDRCIASGRYAHDLETTGLDTRVFDGRTRDHIVGHCLSPDGKIGYYIPVRHRKSAHLNLSVTLVEEEMRRLGDSDAIAIFFNAAFDQEFLAYPGGKPLGSRWDDPRKWEDVALDAYLFNPRDKHRNLKDQSKLHLGMEMIELEDLFPHDHHGKLDFAELDPSDGPVLWYACSDAICTFELWRFFEPKIQDQAAVLAIEKICLVSVRWMERNRVRIDGAKVAELIQLGQEEYFEALIAVYDACKQKLARSIEPTWMVLLRQEFDRTDPKFDILEQIDDMKKRAKLRRGLDDPEPETCSHSEPMLLEVGFVCCDPDPDLSLDLDPGVVLEDGWFDGALGGDICGEGVAQDEGPIRKVINGQLRTFPRYYDVLSPQQLGLLLEELEVPDLQTTEKSGQIDTSAEEIERLTKEYGHAYPFLPKFSRMGELRKALGTYLISLRDDVGPDGTIRVRFRQTGTDTGRFTTPASKNPSQDGGTKFPMHGTPATYDKSRPKCLLRIREAIIPSPGAVLMAPDFSAVELRIATNLSGEPKWYVQFFRCSICGTEFDRGDGQSTPGATPGYCPTCGSDRIGDLHTLTAVVFYGEALMADKDKAKDLRQKAKTANFASVYGGGPKALQAATGCDDNEAHRQYELFGESYPTLGKWWFNIRAFGAQHGYVATIFGRKYPVPDLQLPVSGQLTPQQKMENKKLRSKAERNATNSPIQGGSADITKLAMGLIFKECKKRGWLDKVRMILTMHDELVFDVDLDVLAEASQVIPNIMTRNKPLLDLKWKVPLTSDVEIGYDYTVPWNLKNFQARRVRRDGVEVDFNGKPSKTTWPQAFLDVFGPLYGFADDPDAPKPPTKAEKPQALVHKMELELDTDMVGPLAKMLLRVQGTGQHRLEVKTKDGQNLLWPGAAFLVDPDLCVL